MPKVLVTDFVFDHLEVERDVLEPLGVELVVAPDQSEGTLAREAEGADAMLVCFAKIGARVIEAAASGGGCAVIARYGIGIDNIDVEAASRAGIPVTNVPDYCLDEVADHALAFLLASARGVVAGARDVAAGDWTIRGEGIHRLADRRLALIGLGGIGRRVAARARPFGLEVWGYDPYVAGEVEGVHLAETFEEAVRDAHYVSLHVPMTPENERLIRAETLAQMQAKPLLINTARGGLVDLDDVVAALDDGTLSAVALDVTLPEPLPDGHPLRTHPRAIVTPHMAFHSLEATEELQRRAALEVVRALRGEPADRLVNPEVHA